MVFCMGETFAQEVMRNARKAVEALHWNFFSIEFERMSDGSTRVTRSTGGTGTLDGLLEIYAPSGIIVWFDALTPDEVQNLTGGGIPVVFVERPQSKGRPNAWHHGCVHSDAKSIAAMAAKELALAGCPAFAYVPSTVDMPWNHERGDAFQHCAERAGLPFHRFRWPSSVIGDATPHSADEPLRQWLKTLPRPCGILAANDVMGELLIAACAGIGAAVPDDFAVVSVDNHEYVCEGTTPTMSSIAMDWSEVGRQAVALLAEWLGHPGRPPASRAVSPARLVRRASSRPVRDARVAAAQESIRLHACEEGFLPRDAIRAMGLSSGAAFPLFHRVTGHTPLDEIHAVRLDRAKALLAGGKAPDAVAAECGYASHADFRRVFKRRVGMTVRQWCLKNAR